MEQNIKEIITHFNIEGEFQHFEKITIGHINSSYQIITTSTSHPGYFLQWINTNIFKDVPGLMNNIYAVTNHLAIKLAENPNFDFQVLEVITTNTGDKYYIDLKGQCWRLYKYIPNMHGYNIVENTNVAYEGGKAFGIFMSLLADLPAKGLSETIPNFHSLKHRLNAFFKTLENNPADRAKEIPVELDFINSRIEQMLKITTLIEDGILPTRITHNDTKFNNILFDSNEQAKCIVDLDTVMPGSILFDFGDAIRTGANAAAEDEKDLSLVNINMPIYEAYTQGFISSTHHTLTQSEIDNLAFSARFMTFIIGLRFLTDFVDGDNYFRTAYPEHNLVRARVQFKLVESMELNAKKMNDIVLQSIRNVSLEHTKS